MNNPVKIILVLFILSACKEWEPGKFDCPEVVDYLGRFPHQTTDGATINRVLQLRLRYDADGVPSIDNFEPDYLSNDSLSGVINLVTSIWRNGCRYYLGPIKIRGTYSTTLANGCAYFNFNGTHEYIRGSGCFDVNDTSYRESIVTDNFTIVPYEIY